MESIEQSSHIAAARPRPEIDPAKCVNCRACIDGCPNHAIQEAFDYCCAKCVKYCLVMEVPCRPVRVAISDQRCDGCGVCVSVCSYGAINFWSRYRESVSLQSSFIATLSKSTASNI